MSWPLADAASWAPLRGNRNRVLVAMCFVANGNANGRVWVGEEHLAARLKITPRRVRAHLDALERDGWLRVVAAHAPGHATMREINRIRILETAQQERDRFEAHRRQHRTVASGVQGATPDSSVRCTPDISDTNTGRQRPKNQILNQVLKATAQPFPTSGLPPTIADLVDRYRTLPGVVQADRDGPRVAGLVLDYGADAVHVALTAHRATIGNARKDPLSLLAKILEREHAAQVSARASLARTTALGEYLDRAAAKRSPEPPAEWEQMRATLGVSNGRSASSGRSHTRAKEAAKRAGVSHIGAVLPATVQAVIAHETFQRQGGDPIGKVSADSEGAGAEGSSPAPTSAAAETTSAGSLALSF